jgi:hypothetical protein
MNPNHKFDDLQNPTFNRFQPVKRPADKKTFHFETNSPTAHVKTLNKTAKNGRHRRHPSPFLRLHLQAFFIKLVQIKQGSYHHQRHILK